MSSLVQRLRGAADVYVRFWAQRETAECLALVRICVALVVASDLLQVARLGLVNALMAPIEDGGIGPASHAEPTVALYGWLGASPISAGVLFGLTLGAALALGVGFHSRISALLLMLLSAQLSQLCPAGDRGIDVLLRNVLCLLACSGAGATWSIDALREHGGFAPRVLVAAWPRYLLIAQLVLLYFWAGALKQGSAWTSLGGYSAMFQVLHQPHYTRFALPHAALVASYPLLQAATCATVWFERAAPVIPMLLWLRATRERGGWLRSIVLRAHLFELWVCTGLFFHLSLALLMELGIFPWGCLALYPAWLRPDTLRSLVGFKRSAPAGEALGAH
jgi:hypothetical protein